MSKKFAEVAPAVPLHANSPQTYTYRLPQTNQQPIRQYSGVTIKFGRRQVPGIVLKLHDRPVPYPTKLISTITTTALTKQQITFARWISSTLQGGFGYTLRLFQPPNQRPAADSKDHDAPPRKYGQSKTSQTILNTLKKHDAALIHKDIPQRLKILEQVIAATQKYNQQILTIVPEKKMISGPGLPVSTDVSRAQLTSIWHNIYQEHTHVIRGTQKALFLPFSDLKLIIVEEEQLPSHKLWDQYPRLDNIAAAQALAAIHHCPILYTSSFPSVRLTHAIKTGQVISFESSRIKPQTSIIPFSFTDQLKKYPLPHQLISSLKSWQKTNQSTLLFYNRKNNQSLAKTLEFNLAQSYQQQVTLSTSAIFTSHQHNKFDRIVWLFPEKELAYPDYRTRERALITLARLQTRLTNSRRHITVVTRQPQLIQDTFVANPDIAINAELTLRKRLFLPPYTDIVQLTVKEKQNKKAATRATTLRQELENQAKQHLKSVRIQGPYQSFQRRHRGHFEYHIIIKGPLNIIRNIYSGLDVDYIDLNPHRIL